MLWGQWFHRHVRGDRLWLYYNQPRRHPNFLALKFAVSSRNTTWASMHAGTGSARRNRAHQTQRRHCCAMRPIFRLTPRMLARQGWQPHATSRWHRNYIKRFYGENSQPAKRAANSTTVLAATAYEWALVRSELPLRRDNSPRYHPAPIVSAEQLPPERQSFLISRLVGWFFPRSAPCRASSAGYLSLRYWRWPRPAVSRIPMLRSSNRAVSATTVGDDAAAAGAGQPLQFAGRR